MSAFYWANENFPQIWPSNRVSINFWLYTHIFLNLVAKTLWITHCTQPAPPTTAFFYPRRVPPLCMVAVKPSRKPLSRLIAPHLTPRLCSSSSHTQVHRNKKLHGTREHKSHKVAEEAKTNRQTGMRHLGRKTKCVSILSVPKRSWRLRCL